MNAKKGVYQPHRIKASQVRVLFTPREYVIAGKEVLEEILKKQEEKGKKEECATKS